MISPIRDKIGRLNERFSASKTTGKQSTECEGNERALRIEHLTNRVAYLQDKISELQETQTKK